MKNLLLALFAIFIFNGCSTSSNMAINEYDTGVVTKEPAIGVVTPQMIQEVKKRREAYLKEHAL